MSISLVYKGRRSREDFGESTGSTGSDSLLEKFKEPQRTSRKDEWQPRRDKSKNCTPANTQTKRKVSLKKEYHRIFEEYSLHAHTRPSQKNSRRLKKV